MFGANTKAWLAGLYGLTLVLQLAAYAGANVGFIAYLGLFVAAVMFAWQILVLDIDNPDQCLQLFKFNTRVGAVIFAGLVLALPFA